MKTVSETVCIFPPGTLPCKKDEVVYIAPPKLQGTYIYTLQGKSGTCFTTVRKKKNKTTKHQK